MKMFYEVAPTTGRSAKSLAKAYGFASLAQMAESLPSEAKVVDFGAGKSNLGEAITDLRSDVRWLNVDIRMGLFRHAQRHQRNSGSGLQYLKADVFKPPLRGGTLDRVYSSWLFPHIELDDPVLAVSAIHGIAALLNEKGKLAISGKVTSVVSAAEYHAAPDEVAFAVADRVALRGFTRRQQIAVNRIRGTFNLDRLP